MGIDYGMYQYLSKTMNLTPDEQQALLALMNQAGSSPFSFTSSTGMVVQTAGAGLPLTTNSSPATSMPKKSKYNPGDKVRIVQDKCSHCISIGTEVVLRSKRANPHNSWNLEGYSSYVLETDFEMIGPKKKPVEFDISKLDPLIVTKEVKDEIKAVLKQHKNSAKMFEEWGLGNVIEYGKGMIFLFYGPPGTGKTWAANCIAKVFGQELLSISAAEIQSSEPGGANRNIQNAFKSAEEQGKILFLDECDSLISSRDGLGMILGSEINTLLTEIEKYEGVVVLATNRVENLDAALERRISLIVEFPEPDYEQREMIWTRLLPDKMPLGKGVSAKKLAEYKLTGGQIKNVVLQAARLALSAESTKVELEHFESAIERVNKSKSLMGTASRYQQIVIKEDFRKGH